LTAALAAALPMVPALACSCVASAPAGHFTSADVVFAGPVIDVEVEPVPAGAVAVPASQAQSVTFEVRSVYKGAPGARAVVHAESGGASCGIPFAEEASYLVFARDDGGSYSTSLCSGTTDDLTYLDRAGYSAREISITEAAAARHAEPAEGGRAAWLAGAGLALALVVAWHARRIALRTRYS
jgi:hypothetical protein